MGNAPLDLPACLLEARSNNRPMAKVEFCGADAEGTINREEFGVGFGKNMGFKMETKLAIQVEALAAK